MMRRAALAALWLFACCGALASAAGPNEGLQAVPRLSARVTDVSGTLSEGERSALERKLAAFEGEKGVQLAVLLVPTTQPESIEQYSIRVVDAWKLGRKGVDDGALLIVAQQDRALRIEVGRGLEGALTDLVTHRIIDEIITPQFRRGNFAGGIDAGLERMMSVARGEPLPPPERVRRTQKGSPFERLLPMLFVVCAVVSLVMRAMFGRVLGALGTSAVAFVITWFVIGAVGMALFAGFFAFVLALVAGSGQFARGMSHSGYGGGFGGGGLGGGGFGGGGASGRW